MLTFYFGVMGSGKSAFALMTWHEKHRPTASHHPNRAVLATTMDRSVDKVTSRTGMAAQALRITPGEVTPEMFGGADTVVIDEAQFLTPDDVDGLATLAAAGTDVVCFGLRTDFTSRMFAGSRRLLELADHVGHLPIEPRCARCERPALINARRVNGVVTTEGDTVVIGDVTGGSPSDPDQLGFDDTSAGGQPGTGLGAAGRVSVEYDPMCFGCWSNEVGARRFIDLRQSPESRHESGEPGSGQHGHR